MSCTLYIFSPLLLPTTSPHKLASHPAPQPTTQPPTHPPSHPPTRPPARRTHQPDSSAGLISRTHQPDSSEQDSAGLRQDSAGLTQAGLRQDSGRTQAGLRGQRSEVRGVRGQGSEVRGQGCCITHHTTHIHTPRPPLYPAGCCQFTAFTVC